MIEETMIHPETGEILYRDIRPVKYRYKGESIVVDQPGWYPANGNDDGGILSQEDMKIAGAGIRILKERVKARENSFAVANAALV